MPDKRGQAPAHPGKAQVAIGEVPVRAGYYLFGPEAAVTHVRRDRIRARLDKEAEERGDILVVRRLEGEDAWTGAAAEARLLTFDPCRLILALPQGVPDARAVSALDRALQSPAPGVTLLVVEPAWSARERPAQRLAPLRKSPYALESPELRPPEARAFIGAYAETLGLRLEAGSLDHLRQRTGGHLGTALTELEKFSACLEGPVVRPETVDALTPAEEEEEAIFPVGDALLAGDLRATLRAADRAIQSGQGAFGLVGYLARQASLAAQAQAFLADPTNDPGAVARALGLAPWQAQKIIAAARSGRFEGPRTARAILESQMALRSSVPERLVVTVFLWNLLAPRHIAGPSLLS